MANPANSITSPAVMINNVPFPIVPNSLSFTEGQGMQSSRTESAGGNAVNIVYSDDAKTKISGVKFSVLPTYNNIEALKLIKLARNANVITVTDPDSGLQRTFQLAALVNDYDVNVGSDAQIDVEFQSLPAI